MWKFGVVAVCVLVASVEAEVENLRLDSSLVKKFADSSVFRYNLVYKHGPFLLKSIESASAELKGEKTLYVLRLSIRSEEEDRCVISEILKVPGSKDEEMTLKPVEC